MLHGDTRPVGFFGWMMALSGLRNGEREIHFFGNRPSNSPATSAKGHKRT